MALNLPTYSNPYSTTAATNAYAWIQFLAIDFTSDSGRVQLGVNLDQASADAGLPTIDSFSVSLGQTLVAADPQATPPVEQVNFPDLTGLVTSAAEYAASHSGTSPFDSIRAVLYEALLAHPRLSGATIIDD